MKKFLESQQAMDSFNRYAIAIRGASPEVYGVLETAGIQRQFQSLLSVTLPSKESGQPSLRSMRPLEHLDAMRPHTAWMTDFKVVDSETGEDESEVEIDVKSKIDDRMEEDD